MVQNFSEASLKEWDTATHDGHDVGCTHQGVYVGALPDEVEVAGVGSLVEAAGPGEARQPAVAVHLQVGPDQSQLSGQGDNQSQQSINPHNQSECR